MEENQPKTGKFALTYGLLLGGASAIFSLMLYSMDMHYQNEWPVLIISIALSLTALIVAMIQFKKANNGFMSFGQALKVGVGVCLIGGVIAIIFGQIMMNFIDPDMLSKTMEFQRQKLMEGTALPPDQIEAQLAMQEKFTTPSMIILFGLLTSIISGFIYSLIPALVLKKQEVLD
jgi:ABC-type antimicrobial peptide transport system permease subunit